MDVSVPCKGSACSPLPRLGERPSGTYTVTLQDGIGRQSSVGFGVIHDATPPTLTLAALMHGTDVHVTWSVEDSGSGVDTGTCRLEVREDEGTWQVFSTECVGDDTYNGQPGHTYAFRLAAADNVANDDSLEAEAAVPYAKKYYYANGQRACPERSRRVAMREGDVVYYIYTDHPPAGSGQATRPSPTPCNLTRSLIGLHLIWA